MSSPSNHQHHLWQYNLAMFKNVQIPESSPLNVAGAAYLVSPLMFNVFTFNDHCYICSCQRIFSLECVVKITNQRTGVSLVPTSTIYLYALTKNLPTLKINIKYHDRNLFFTFKSSRFLPRLIFSP